MKKFLTVILILFVPGLVLAHPPPAPPVDVPGSITTLVPSVPVTKSIYWSAGAMSPDGVQCNPISEAQINSGPIRQVAICADNDASQLEGSVVMTDGWGAGTLVCELEYVQTAADTNVLNSDLSCQCRGATETINNTFGTEVAIDDAAVSGSSAVDHTSAAAMTCNGTCAAGDTLTWRWQLDATGTTTAVATLNILGMKCEVTSTVGD